MKPLLILLTLGLLTGCASSPDKEAQCAQARTLYEAYQASLLVRQPSKDEAAAAAAAALVLTSVCGWHTASTDRGLVVDPWGVPILTAP